MSWDGAAACPQCKFQLPTLPSRICKGECWSLERPRYSKVVLYVDEKLPLEGCGNAYSRFLGSNNIGTLLLVIADGVQIFVLQIFSRV